MNKSAIEWTDATRNPASGCTKVSQGCKNCYAERITNRFGGKGAFDKIVLHPERLDWPLRVRKPKKIFVNSMADLFHEQVPEEFAGHVFATMARCPQHTFQILTKRPEIMLDLIGNAEARWGPFQDAATLKGDIPDWPLLNVWLGISAENQETFDARWPYLRDTPAAVRFVSYEPALGPLDVAAGLPRQGDGGVKPPLHWLIAGGESGPKARPAHPDWFRKVRDQCSEVSIPFFFKQWGEWLWHETYAIPGCGHESSTGAEGPALKLGRPVVIFKCDLCGQLHDDHGIEFERVGKKRAGRLLDGKEWSEFPILARSDFSTF